MGYNQAYSAYKETSVKTASQGKLIVMLYDEANRQILAALSCFDSSKTIPAHSIERFNNHILKTQEIITELMVSLDMNAGGDIAKNLLNLYIYFNQELLEANLERNSKKLVFVQDMMNQLRATWAEIVNSASNKHTASHAGINING